MTAGFRESMFALCKHLSTMSQTEEVRQLVRSMNVIMEKDGIPVGQNEPLHGDLARVAIHERAQFLGYLLADEHADGLYRQGVARIEPLNERERSAIGGAHATLMALVESCTGKLRRDCPEIFPLLDPYGRYTTAVVDNRWEPFLSEGDLSGCADAFVNSRLYRQLVEGDLPKVLRRSRPGDSQRIADALGGKLTGDLGTLSDEELRDLRRPLMQTSPRVEDVFQTQCLYCHALRLSLETALQMMFDAIMGQDLIVMDNNNVIDIQNHNYDLVYERYVVLLQGVVLRVGGPEVGCVTLLTCNPSDRKSVKEFGVVSSLSTTFSSELGITSKMTILTLDEDLNRIHRLTDALLRAKGLNQRLT